ncbi:MAG: F0F1 ATP synthase subunit delta [Alphaproteobacteria bacterium]|nr:F0F1 ATP synthase subunit delta [Alphaproteobacteria bacterium]
MGFSWVTFFAQIINLFLLVWLLKKFLYRPILSAIEKRQAYIEDKVKKADEAVKSAQKQEEKLNKQVRQWEKDKQKRLDELDTELEAYRREERTAIEREARDLRQKMQDALNRESASMQLEIRDMMAGNFLNLSQKVLTDLSRLAPMEQAVTLFRKKVSDLPKADVKSIRDVLKKKNQIIISSSAELTEKEQKSLSSFLKEQFGESAISYRVQPDLILGIEALIGETVLEWNLKSYLDHFEGNLNAALAGLIVKE